MYEAFYGLRDRPFNLTPDPKYLYLSEKHKEAFAHLLYGIKNRSGFVMVSGEIGTGKTTICRTLLNQLDDDTEVAFIFNPSLSPDELLRSINSEFGIESKADSVLGLIQELNAYLLQGAQDEKNCVLVIDEAQNLAPSVLEQVRLLSNLETESQKLLQIVLIGQPELAEHLALDELRQLNQRITARYHLEALGQEETLQYIAYRLRVAGGRRKVQFSKGAVRLIHRHASGTPRVINAICDRCLLIGYTKETRTITPGIVKQAIKEVRGKAFKPRASRREAAATRTPLAWPTYVAIGAIFAFAAMYFFGPVQREPAPAEPPVAAVEDDSTAPKATGLMPQAEAAIESSPPPVEVELEKLTEFEEAMANLDPDSAREAAASRMLRLWNMADIAAPPKGDQLEDLVDFAKGIGLEAEPLTANLSELQSLGLPAFIKVYTPGDWAWVTLAGVMPDRAVISTTGRESLTVPIQELAAVYRGNEAVVLWRDPAPDAEVMKPGSRGAAVKSLQESLVLSGILEGTPSGRYDEATAEAVREMQRRTGLEDDGLAGRQTRMVMSSWNPEGHVPALAPREVVAALNDAPAPPPIAAPMLDGPAAPAEETPTVTPEVAPAPEPAAAQEPVDTTPAPNEAPTADVPEAAAVDEAESEDAPVADESATQEVAEEVPAAEPNEAPPADDAQSTTTPLIEEEDLNPPTQSTDSPPTALPLIPAQSNQDPQS